MVSNVRRINLFHVSMSRPLFLLCLCITGFTGLVAEICWIKKGILFFGSTIYSMSIVTAVFFLGLAIGNFIFGKNSTRITQPVQWYLLCELATGMLIAVSPQLFVIIEKAVPFLYPLSTETPFVLFGIKTFLFSICLIPPTVLMGASLPLLNKYFITNNQQITNSVSSLYAINTLGGVVGVFISGFICIPKFGLSATLMYAGLINIVTTGILLSLFFRYKTTPIKTVELNEQSEILVIAHRKSSRTERFYEISMYVLFCIAGIASMGNQLIWVRYLGLIIHNTVYSYTITLGILLLGIVSGSIIVRFFSKFFTKHASVLFGLVTILCGFSGIMVLWIPPQFWNTILTAQTIPLLFLLSFSVLFLPSLVMGISFPIGLRMAILKYTNAPKDVGFITAFNLIGSICGSVVFGLIILPLVGLETSIILNALLYLLIGTSALLLFSVSGISRIRNSSIAGCALTLFVIAITCAPVQIPQSYLSLNGEIISFTESVNSTISVVRNKYNMITLEIDRLWQGSNQKTHQVMAAHIPSMLYPDVKKIAVIGVGAGQTAQRFLLYPIQQLDCIDIEKSIFPLLRKYFFGAWLDDPRVRIIIDDGRDYVKHTSNTYDLFSIEIGQLFRPQCSWFYSHEFYKAIKKKLNKNALVCQFVPLTFLDKSYFLRVIKTFIDVFPQSTLWFNSNELLLIGTSDSLQLFDIERVSQLLKKPEISSDCSFSMWGGKNYSYNRLEHILATYLCGPRTLDTITKGYKNLYDDRPELEYATARHQNYTVEELNYFMDFLALWCDSFVSILRHPITDSMIKTIEFSRKYNLLNVKAVSFLQRYFQTGSEEDLKQAYQMNPLNLDILLQTALFASQRNDSDGAYQLYNQILTIDSTFSPAYNNLGTMAEQKGNFVEATRLYRIAAQKDSSNNQAYVNLVSVYKKRDMIDSAACFMHQALLPDKNKDPASFNSNKQAKKLPY